MFALRKSLALAPHDAEAWAMLGDISLEIYRAKGDRPRAIEAVQAWKRSLEIDPNQPRLTKLVRIYDRPAKDR